MATEAALRGNPDSLASAEFVETRSVTLEWKLTNLRTLFESSKGDGKSKCVKSQPFDGNRWQLMFYANSGQATGSQDQSCSVYLSCEPTAAEREAGLQLQFQQSKTNPTGKPGDAVAGSAISGSVGGAGSTVRDANKGPWKREGKFRFTFELRTPDRKQSFKVMEAHDHSFSDTARNWGYASFVKRSEAYFNNAPIRAADAFLIVCTIVSSPTPPSPPPLPRLLIPKDLVSAYASLFDDPQYSDVCFRIRPTDRERPEKRIYAAKKILSGRAGYFEDMFSSGFSESSMVPHSLPPSSLTHSRNSSTSSLASASSSISDWDEDDDSSSGSISDEPFEEGEEESVGGDSDDETATEVGVHNTSVSSISSGGESGVEDDEVGEEETEREGVIARKKSVEGTFVDAKSALDEPRMGSGSGATVGGGQRERRVSEGKVGKDGVRESTPKKVTKEKENRRPMMEVVVTDAAYTSFRALLFWLYTDSITFAPLASTYHVARDTAAQLDQPFTYPTRRAFLLATNPFVNKSPTMPGPCSAKAIYRLADKIGLPELKERAFEHVVKSLTVQNIPYEVFGSFSLKFSEIQRIEVAFLCEKWNEVRSSPSMHKVLSNIRLMGRFPGFEEVFRLILPYLQYIPPAVADEERP